MAAAACLLLVAIGPAMLTAQGSEEGARARILALKHAWNQAEVFADLKALDSLFDRDLIYVDFDGSMLTKSEVLARLKSAHIQQAVTELMTVQVFDDTAIVNGSYRLTQFKDGKMVVHRGRFTDTWMYKNSAWVCIAAQSTPTAPQGVN